MKHLQQLCESVRECIRMMAAFRRVSYADDMTEALEHAREKQARQGTGKDAKRDDA